jgi:hypothetical protein
VWFLGLANLQYILTNWQTRTIITQEKTNMVKKITFYDKDEAIQYQLKMRWRGYLAKMIRREDRYEVIMAGEAPEWQNPTEVQSVGDVSEGDDE